MSIESEPTESTPEHSPDQRLNSLITKSVDAIESGKELEGLEKSIKNTPTGILAASPDHDQTRFQPGEKLVTYNGIDESGNPIQETWGGGVAEINDDSVILKNEEPIRYPEGHKLSGQEVRGDFQPDGIFVVNQDTGNETLFNEYVSDKEFVQSAYGIDASSEWQTRLKLEPSYLFEIPDDVENTVVKTRSGVEINVGPGDYVAIDTKKGKVNSIRGIEKSWKDKTYVSWDEYTGGDQ